jgi:hypothetical protein
MTARLMGGSSLLRRWVGVFDWDITAIECADGLARIEARSGLTEIVVGDTNLNSDVEYDGFTAVACTVDGGAFVLAWQAPPALLITPQGHRVAPPAAGEPELVHLEPGDRLLLLSSAAYEDLPHALSQFLHGPPHAVPDADPVELLQALFDGVGAGAGAVISRTGRNYRSSERWASST